MLVKRGILPLHPCLRQNSGATFAPGILPSSFFPAPSRHVIIAMLPPLHRHRKGVYRLDEYFIAFTISVVASVVAYYICKWLDRD